MKGIRSMKKELKSDRLAYEMNFKRPCWLALFVSLGAMLAGYGAYYGIFPLGIYDADRPWQTLMETRSFLLLAAGAVGFATSLIWWFVAAIEFRLRGSRGRPAAALAT